MRPWDGVLRRGRIFMAGMECRYTGLLCSGSRKPTLRSAKKAVRFAANRFAGLRQRLLPCRFAGAESLQTRVRAERFALACLGMEYLPEKNQEGPSTLWMPECRAALRPDDTERHDGAPQGKRCSILRSLSNRFGRRRFGACRCCGSCRMRQHRGFPLPARGISRERPRNERRSGLVRVPIPQRLLRRGGSGQAAGGRMGELATGLAAERPKDGSGRSRIA